MITCTWVGFPGIPFQSCAGESWESKQSDCKCFSNAEQSNWRRKGKAGWLAAGTRYGGFCSMLWNNIKSRFGVGFQLSFINWLSFIHIDGSSIGTSCRGIRSSRKSRASSTPHHCLRWTKGVNSFDISEGLHVWTVLIWFSVFDRQDVMRFQMH